MIFVIIYPRQEAPCSLASLHSVGPLACALCSSQIQIGWSVVWFLAAMPDLYVIQGLDRCDVDQAFLALDFLDVQEGVVLRCHPLSS